jgi:hypothetical protein
VTPAHAGNYTVRVTDNIGPTESQPAALVVWLDPIFLVHPASQSAPSGSGVTLSASILGFPPPFSYEWRRLSTPITSNNSIATVTFFTTNLFGGIPANSSTGQYRVVIRNAARPSGVISAVATLLLATDTDGDGLPDDWESAYFNSATAADPNADTDGDRMTNAQEYRAGTDPTDAMSFLKVESIEIAGSTDLQVQLEFNAVSNRTYSVLFSENQPDGPWAKVADVVASQTNRLVQMQDQRPALSLPRYYRLVTPKNP